MGEFGRPYKKLKSGWLEERENPPGGGTTCRLVEEWERGVNFSCGIFLWCADELDFGLFILFKSLFKFHRWGDPGCTGIVCHDPGMITWSHMVKGWGCQHRRWWETHIWELEGKGRQAGRDIIVCGESNSRLWGIWWHVVGKLKSRWIHANWDQAAKVISWSRPCSTYLSGRLIWKFTHSSTSYILFSSLFKFLRIPSLTVRFTHSSTFAATYTQMKPWTFQDAPLGIYRATWD